MLFYNNQKLKTDFLKPTIKYSKQSKYKYYKKQVAYFQQKISNN